MLSIEHVVSRKTACWNLDSIALSVCLNVCLSAASVLSAPPAALASLALHPVVPVQSSTSQPTRGPTQVIPAGPVQFFGTLALHSVRVCHGVHRCPAAGTVTGRVPARPRPGGPLDRNLALEWLAPSKKSRPSTSKPAFKSSPGSPGDCRSAAAAGPRAGYSRAESRRKLGQVAACPSRWLAQRRDWQPPSHGAP